MVHCKANLPTNAGGHNNLATQCRMHIWWAVEDILWCFYTGYPWNRADSVRQGIEWPIINYYSDLLTDCPGPFGQPRQNTTNWVAYKQNTFISPNLEAGSLKIQYWLPASWFIVFSLFLHLLCVREFAGVSFIRVLILSWGLLPHVLIIS